MTSARSLEHKTAAPALEHKSVPLRGIEIKETGSGWEVAGYASTFSPPDAPKSEADSYGDLILAGAFAKSISSRPTKLYSEHQTAIGTQLELREDDHGLYGRWAIVDSTVGTDAHKLAKAGVLDALSIGFFAIGTEYRSDGVRLISEAEVVEVSLVGIGANPHAKVTSVKSAAAPVDLDQVRSRLGRLGIDTASVPTHGGSLGARVVADAGVKALLAGRVQVAVVPELDTRALISSGGLGAAVDAPALRDDLMVPVQPPAILNFFRTEAASAGSIIVPISSGLSGALAVAEATALTGTSGTKPEGTLTWQDTVFTLSTVADWVPATTRALTDAGTLGAMIDNELRSAIMARLEHDTLEGSGAAGEMVGLWGLAGATEVVVTGVAGALAGIARAIGRCNESGRVCSVVAVSAQTYSALLEGNAAALIGQVFTVGGVPLIPTTGLTAGRALAIAGSTVILWARPLTVTVGMIGQDFARNLRRVLGEVDAVIVASRPTSVVRVSGLPT